MHTWQSSFHLARPVEFLDHWRAHQRCHSDIFDGSHRVHDTAQALFQREVSILKACRNKNIVSFLGQFVQDQKTWLIMEYMEVRRTRLFECQWLSAPSARTHAVTGPRKTVR